jgi:hypothetical protein
MKVVSIIFLLIADSQVVCGSNVVRYFDNIYQVYASACQLEKCSKLSQIEKA